MTTKRVLAAALVAAAALLSSPARSGACQLQLGTRGTFREAASASGRCLTFVDVLGNVYEVTNPRGAYRDGLSGVAWAQYETAGVCTDHDPIRICMFDGDFTKRITGDLVFRNFIECPGYVIAASGLDYRIYNCDDYGVELCDPANLGRRIHAQVWVEETISICLGQAKSFVLDYRFQD